MNIISRWFDPFYRSQVVYLTTPEDPFYSIFDLIISHLREDIDGAIYSILYHCRPAASSSHSLKKVIEETQKIPVLQLEIDLWDHRYHNADAMRVWIETFAEMLKQRNSKP